MIIVASTNGRVGICQAMEVLKSGGSALDAVETAIRLVEDNPEDNSVGYGGLPNILGKVELDASIMDGKSLAAGAIGCLSGFRYPISIARQVMEHLPHVFLVGAGAERFATEIGAERREMLTQEAFDDWQTSLKDFLPAGVSENIQGDENLAHWVRMLTNPNKSTGTVNFIARDSQGNLCAGVSTSGWFNKYPGRLGDSPVIGAGNYADNRYGAAACTGMGEMAIRASTARSVVLYMKMGMSLEEAGRQAMQDLNDLSGPYLSGMNIVALDKDGNPGGFSTNEEASYIWMTDQMDQPIEAPRVYIPVKNMWGD